MADVTSGITIKDGGATGGIRRWVVYTAATADAADTFTFELDDHGITNLLFVHGFSHTTTDSVIVEEAPTTSVSGVQLTVTIPAGTDNDQRVYEIVGRGNA